MIKTTVSICQGQRQSCEGHKWGSRLKIGHIFEYQQVYSTHIRYICVYVNKHTYIYTYIHVHMYTVCIYIYTKYILFKHMIHTHIIYIYILMYTYIYIVIYIIMHTFIHICFSTLWHIAVKNKHVLYFYGLFTSHQSPVASSNRQGTGSYLMS